MSKEYEGQVQKPALAKKSLVREYSLVYIIPLNPLQHTHARAHIYS